MIGHLIAFSIPAAYTLLPPSMHSRAATALMLAIALQESRIEYRRQQPLRAGMPYGPARGFWQFEKNGGVAGVLLHPKTRPYAESAAAALKYPADPGACHEAITHNDVLAAVFARLLLWTLPEPLPSPANPDEAWRQYLSAWRPGKPHPETWASFYERAWDVVAG